MWLRSRTRLAHMPLFDNGPMAYPLEYYTVESDCWHCEISDGRPGSSKVQSSSITGDCRSGGLPAEGTRTFERSRFRMESCNNV